jgi:Fe-S-cluster containining protein
MPFECIQCGVCCENLGLVYTISEDLGDYRFLICNTHTGEETTAIVDPDKRDLFRDTGIFSAVPHACPFFRRHPDDSKAYCTIHETRPDICRKYQCWRMLILDHTGRRAGKIPHSRSLRSEDSHLTRIWTECIEAISEQDDRIWEEMMIKILRRSGYSVRK